MSLGFFPEVSSATVTVSFAGRPDFLSGEWRQLEGRSPKLAAMRFVDLDGKGPKMWEWVGPNEGILVWNPSGDSKFQPGFRDFFGLGTWGKSWSDGVEALRSLDQGGDEVLSGGELENIWVWVDKDGDAVVGAEELKPLADYGVGSLSVGFSKLGVGAVGVKEGAVAGGKTYPIVDWWSLGGMDAESFDQYIAEVLAESCVYSWKPEAPAPKGVEGGLVRYFISPEGDLVAVSLPFSQGDMKEMVGLLVPYVPLEDGTFFSRADMGDSFLDNYLTIGAEDTLVGMTASLKKADADKVVPPDRLEGVLRWTATRVQGPSLPQVLDAAAARIMREVGVQSLSSLGGSSGGTPPPASSLNTGE